MLKDWLEVVLPAVRGMIAHAQRNMQKAIALTWIGITKITKDRW